MTAQRSNPRAFTIIEVLTIVVVLGVLAGITLPRLFGNESRLAGRELQSVEDLLSAAATREAFSSTPVALEYADATLKLVMLRAPEDFTPWSGDGTWVDDPLARRVTFSHLQLSTASASGLTLAPDEWRIDLTTLEARPAVALGVTDGNGNDWVIYLAPDADQARTMTLDAASTLDMLEQTAIDLDLSGREEDPW